MVEHPILLLFLVLVVSACQSGRSQRSFIQDQPILDGFSQSSHEQISTELKQNKEWQKSLHFESEWLSLRSQVVDAQKYACECRLSELKLAAEMANFGTFDQRFPDRGFINDTDRIRWNAQLEVKKSARVTAEARVNLLRRDLNDLKQKIVKAGYQLSGDSVSK